MLYWSKPIPPIQKKAQVIHMALQILKTSAALPNPEETYPHYASVEVRCRTGLRRLFVPPAGTVSLSPLCDPARPVIQVVPPVWRNGRKEERKLLQQCYTRILRLALELDCDAVLLPLLTEADPHFPVHTDYQIAVKTIRRFLRHYASHPVDVFLMVSRPQSPALHAQVEHFLARNWSGTPMPRPTMPIAMAGPGSPPLPPPNPWRAGSMPVYVKRTRQFASPFRLPPDPGSPSASSGRPSAPGPRSRDWTGWMPVSPKRC